MDVTPAGGSGKSHRGFCLGGDWEVKLWTWSSPSGLAPEPRAPCPQELAPVAGTPLAPETSGSTAGHTDYSLPVALVVSVLLSFPCPDGSCQPDLSTKECKAGGRADPPRAGSLRRKAAEQLPDTAQNCIPTQDRPLTVWPQRSGPRVRLVAHLQGCWTLNQVAKRPS